MPNSLRSKIKHLAYKGELNERERDRILNALDREAKWIPCSVRLPLENARVLVTNGERVNVGWVDKDNYPYWMLEEDGCNYSDIIAWMPLPTPYQPPKMMCEED